MLFFSLTSHTQSATKSYWLFFQNVFIVYLKFKCNWNPYFYLHTLPTLPTRPYLTCAPCYLLPSSPQPSPCSHTGLAICQHAAPTFGFASAAVLSVSASPLRVHFENYCLTLHSRSLLTCSALFP